MAISTPLLVLGTPALLALLVYRLLRPRPLPGIPHRPITSMLGDIGAISEIAKQNKPLVPNFFEKNARELGPIYQVLLGPTHLLVLSDVDEMEDVLVRRAKCVDASGSTRKIMGALGPYGQPALRMDDLWKKHRRLGGPSMSVKYLKQMSPRISNSAQTLVSYWKEKMAIVGKSGGTCFGALDDFEMCTMDAISELAFGEQHNGVEKARSVLPSARAVIDSHGGVTFPDMKPTALHQAVMQHMERISTLFNTPTFLLRPVLFFLKRSSSFRRDDELIRDVVRSRIEQAKKRAINVNETGGSEIADCILDLIVEKDMKETGLSYKEDELLGEMMDYLFAGSDTTASALSFGVKFLSKHPSVQIKLHEELVSNFGSNRLISYDEVGSAEKTPYLEAVANEILRLAQVGAGMTRELLEDMVILGKHVPKGTEVLFLTGFAGRLATKSWGAAKARGSPSFKPSKGLWDDEDVEEFKPERWLIDGPDGQKVFSSKQGYSVPFGLGPKSCFGQKLAMLELKIILATISLAFFLNEVPAELNTSELVQKLTRKPAECYVSLVDWEDVKHGR